MSEYALFNIVLGHALIAKNSEGISHLAFGDQPEVLAQTYLDYHPDAQTGNLNQYIDSLKHWLTGKTQQLGWPLSIQGSDFQKRVWSELINSQYGETLSYQQLAKRVGKDKASRAVASACAANTIAIAIPCHRVVRINGHLSGYRWGVERKQWLLKHEVGKR